MLVLAASVLSLALAPAPGASPSASGRDARVGPFVLEQSTSLTWPGPYVGDFQVAPDLRWVHRFSLGFAHRPLRLLSLDVVVVEASQNPVVRRRALRPPPYPAYNTTGSFWAGITMKLPRPEWALTVGQARLPMAPRSDGPPRILPAAGVPKLSITGRI